MPFIPFPEYRPDVDDFRGAHTQVLSGVLPRGDGYGPARALQPFSAALAGSCRGTFYARKTDGTIVLFAATATNLYRLDNTTLAWTLVSKGGLSYSALPTSDNWQFAQFGNNVVATQANTVPQVFDISSNTNFVDLAGSPPTARYVTVVGRFLVLSGLTSNPNRVHWSDLDGITTWSAGTGFANFVDLPDGGVVRGVAGGEFGLLLQESATRRMVYVAGAKPAFQLERIGEEIGLLGPYSLIRAGSRLFFYSAQGFQAFAGGIGGGVTPIGKERVDRTFAADLDTGALQLLVGAQDPSGTRVFWAYKSVNGQTGLADKALCYDYALDRWAPISVNCEFIASMTKPGLTLDGLNSVSSSIDALTFPLDDVSTAVLSNLSAFDPAHRLGFFNGTNAEAILETPEQGIDNRRIFIPSGIEPRTDATTVFGSIRYRGNAQSSLAATPESAINTQGICPARIDTKLARARIRIPAGTSWTNAMGATLDFTASGQR